MGTSHIVGNGNIYEYKVKGGHIFHADCLDCLRMMNHINWKVDLILGSPPYAEQRTYLEDGEDLNIAMDVDDWVKWMVKVYKASLRVCNGLVAFVVGHGAGCRKWNGAPFLLGARLLREGICLRRPMFYHRHGFMGSGGNDYVRADIEYIIVAANDAKRLDWSDNTACGHVPKYGPGGEMSHRMKEGRRVNNPDGYKSGKVKRKHKRYRPPERANPGDIIFCGAVGGGHMGSNISHENEAPYTDKIPNFWIRSFCRPRGTVLDPFGGSGTTGAEAVKLGRKFIMADLRKSQVKLMQRRVKQAWKQRGLGLLQ